MKWVILLLSCLPACGQQTLDSKNNGKSGPEVFNSKYVRLIEDTSKMMLIENVVIEFGDLYVEADSVLLDKPEKTVTAFGIRKVRFKGNEVDKKIYKNAIRYKKGEAQFYND